MKRILSLLLITAVSGSLWANPETEAHSPSQQVADLIREAAGAQAAFLPAGLVKNKPEGNALVSILRFPDEEIAIVKLKGSQIRAALERSVALFPSPTDCFLQLSNMEASFSRSANPDQRVRSATIAGQALADATEYEVAMPVTLARGGLGYFRVWDKTQTVRVLEGVTLGSVVGQKALQETAPRWRALQ